MVELTLKACEKCPELLLSLSLRSFTKSNILYGFELISKHKPPPPLFYTQFTYNLLKNTPQFSTASLILKDVDYSSLTSAMKTAVRSYYKIQRFKIEEFTNQDSIKMVQALSSLVSSEHYKETSTWLLDYFCDKLIRIPDSISASDSILILKSLKDIHNSVPCAYLSKICKATALSLSSPNLPDS